MPFLTVLKGIGKGLKDAIPWIEKGLETAGGIVAVIDPPLVPIITEIENFFNSSTTKLTETQIEAIVTAITTLATVKASVTPAPPVS